MLVAKYFTQLVLVLQVHESLTESTLGPQFISYEHFILLRLYEWQEPKLDNRSNGQLIELRLRFHQESGTAWKEEYLGPSSRDHSLTINF